MHMGATRRRRDAVVRRHTGARPRGIVHARHCRQPRTHPEPAPQAWESRRPRGAHARCDARPSPCCAAPAMPHAPRSRSGPPPRYLPFMAKAWSRTPSPVHKIHCAFPRVSTCGRHLPELCRTPLTPPPASSPLRSNLRPHNPSNTSPRTGWSSHRHTLPRLSRGFARVAAPTAAAVLRYRVGSPEPPPHVYGPNRALGEPKHLPHLFTGQERCWSRRIPASQAAPMAKDPIALISFFLGS
jgi:hypothetical protein